MEIPRVEVKSGGENLSDNAMELVVLISNSSQLSRRVDIIQFKGCIIYCLKLMNA